MTEVARIVDQLDRAFDGDAWHGPSVMRVLRGVDAAEAFARPVDAGHSIGEVVGHLVAWTREVAARLEGRLARNLPPEENFPPVSHPTEEGWRRTVAELEDAHRALRDLATTLDSDRLDDQVPGPEGESWTAYATLHGLIQHHLYHAGQIALLRRG